MEEGCQQEAAAAADSIYLFSGKHDPLSNFYPAQFQLDGITYSNVEQYFQAEKAKYFKDYFIRQAIIGTTDPSRAKTLGARVTPFRNEEWIQVREDVMKKGVKAKFVQNKGLKKRLCDTKDKTLAEATRDRTWGVGISISHRPTTWNGQNLLGKILMEVRGEILQSDKRVCEFTT